MITENLHITSQTKDATEVEAKCKHVLTDNEPRVEAKRKIVFINKNLQKLIKNKSIIENGHPGWLTNMVLVKKKNGKDRICLDFVDSSKTYPKNKELEYGTLLNNGSSNSKGE